MRERIKRGQTADRDGWDCIPAAHVCDVLPLHHPRNNLTQRPQPTATLSAKKPVVVLLMPSLHELLSDTPLIDCRADTNQHGDLQCQMTDPRRASD